MIVIYVRHSKDCSHKDDRYYRRCGCPLWAQYQFDCRQIQVSLKTRSWEKADLKAKKLQEELDARELGVVKPNDPITLRAAIETYLRHISDAKKQRAASTLRKPRRMMDLLLEYCEKQNPPILMLQSITPMLLEDWRASWTFKADSSSPQVHDTCARAFFKWAYSMELLQRDPYAKLERYASHDPQTLPLSVEAMKRILDAVNEVGLTPTERYNLRGLILCQRWSGLSIIDALTLSRNRLYPDNSIELYRTKTGEVVITALPAEVAEHMRMLSNRHAGYFWWDGVEKLDTIRQRYSTWLRLVFDHAGISRDIDGMALSHRFRDTFAVEFLQAGEGGRMEDLSKLLGHSNIRTTEKHYAAWTVGRRDRLRRIAEESFKLQQPVGLEVNSLEVKVQ